MTLSFKRFIPYTDKELEHGIKKAPLNAHWRILSMKIDNDMDYIKLSIQHLPSKYKTGMIIVRNFNIGDGIKDKRGYIYIDYKRRSYFRCIYGIYDNNAIRAFYKTLRNPYLVMNLFNLKSKKLPYEYCTKKFGPIFDNPRCNEWQLHL